MRTFKSGIFDLYLAIVTIALMTGPGIATAGDIYGLGNTELFGIGNTSARFASNLYSIDTSTGTATLIGATGTSLRGPAINPITGRAKASGARLGSDDGLWEVDLTTGLATFVGGTRNMSDMVFDTAGTLYGMDSRQSQPGLNRTFYT